MGLIIKNNDILRFQNERIAKLISSYQAKLNSIEFKECSSATEASYYDGQESILRGVIADLKSLYKAL